VSDRFASDYAYNFRGGCLNVGGREAAVAAERASGRLFPAMREGEVQEAVRRKLAGEAPLADFVLAAVHDRAVRLAREARLRTDAIPFAWPRATVIAGDR